MFKLRDVKDERWELDGHWVISQQGQNDVENVGMAPTVKTQEKKYENFDELCSSSVDRQQLCKKKLRSSLMLMVNSYLTASQDRNNNGKTQQDLGQDKYQI